MEDLHRTPVKEASKGGKQTKDKTDQLLEDIRTSLNEHLGCPAILFIKESREMVPYFVELGTTSPGSKMFVASHRCYAPDGSFRCFLNYNVDVIKIMVGEQKLVFFDEGI